jgi:hypothetical protein
VEFYLLRRGLTRYIGLVSVPAKLMAKLWSVALIAAAGAYGIKSAVGTNHPLPLAVVSLGVYGAVYWLGTLVTGVEEVREIGAQLFRRLPKRFMRE